MVIKLKKKFLKRFLILPLLIAVFITGCASDDDIDFPYSSQIANNSISIPIAGSDNLPAGYLFSDYVYVVPAGSNDTDEQISASAAMIINQTSKTALFASNAYEKIYPASITKILTAYITIKYANLDDIVEISHEAVNIDEDGIKLCGYNEGDKVSVRDLLYSMLIYSGNDAATALGCYISGTENEFAKLMNEEAKRLGATDSHFTNANGLHNDNHYTTAYDLYLIFAECMKSDTFKSVINTSSYTVEYTDSEGNALSKTFETTNKYLLGSCNAPAGVTVIGGKTGTTSKAGYCLILYSEDTDGNSYISMILNSDSSDSLYKQMNYLLSLINM